MRLTVLTQFVNLSIMFIFILDHESSGHATHDSHKLQTKGINRSTRHYMNRRVLESDQPIHVPLLDVLSFLSPMASVCTCTVAIARRHAPHLATTRKDMPGATVLCCTATHIHVTVSEKKMAFRAKIRFRVMHTTGWRLLRRIQWCGPLRDREIRSRVTSTGSGAMVNLIS